MEVLLLLLLALCLGVSPPDSPFFSLLFFFFCFSSFLSRKRHREETLLYSFHSISVGALDRNPSLLSFLSFFDLYLSSLISSSSYCCTLLTFFLFFSLLSLSSPVFPCHCILAFANCLCLFLSSLLLVGFFLLCVLSPGVITMIALTWSVHTRGYFHALPRGFVDWNSLFIKTLFTGISLGCSSRVMRISFAYCRKKNQTRELGEEDK